MKEINKVKTSNRRKAKEVYGEGGSAPNKAKLQSSLRKNRNLNKEERERIQATLDQYQKDRNFKGFRATYRTQLKAVDTSLMDTKTKARFNDKLEKAERAVWRDSGSELDFETWRGRN